MSDGPNIVVIGAGIAGLSAALAAREAGASVTVLERAPRDERGGNTRFSNSAMRAVYDGVDDIVTLVPDLGEGERARTDFGRYTRDEYLDDMARVTHYRTDPDLAELLVDYSAETLRWLKANGVKFLPLYDWHPKLPDGTIKFSGGSAVEAWGAGEGIVQALFDTAEKRGIAIRYETRAVSLIENESRICGVEVSERRRRRTISCDAIVIACGGFEANAEWRTRYLGPGWELAKVRGSRFNTGDGLRMALDVGAMSHGHWSGCHAASWDLNAPDVNELEFGTVFKRDDFMYGILVNASGERFVDEGYDIRALTYAKLGRVILAQPGQFAWQVFDSKTLSLLHGEYRNRRSARATAGTLEELAGKLDGVNRDGFLATVAAYNRAVCREMPFNPAIKDRRGTVGLSVPKSNWATTIDEPPFEAYGVTCGITFTFGGVKIDRDGRVIDVDGRTIAGLYAAGEMVGGLFYFNYPGGAGLTSAAVFGRIAGKSAAADWTRAAASDAP
jgi:tricarballylate dehydrogenase